MSFFVVATDKYGATGLGILTLPCLLGILARLAQACKQHERIEDLMLELIDAQKKDSSPAYNHPQ